MSAVTVVVPTYNEAQNVEELLSRLDRALIGHDAEVIIVDDGCDDLPSIVGALADRVSISVRVIRRDNPVGRLGGAVVEGMRHSRHDLVIVCDGDLQHPPELIPSLLCELAENDLVVASRYTDGGDPGGLDGGVRRFASRATGVMSKVIFPVRLRGCADPMSGFFAVRCSCVDLESLRPLGFKILLEIVARSQPMRLAEVPFTFGHRVAGESHATLGEGLRFLRQLARLRVESSKALLFLLVGMSGVIPNIATLALLSESGVHYMLALVLAVQSGVLWNFAGAELFVWRDRKVGRLRHRFAKYLVIGETDLFRLPFVIVMVSVVGMSSVLASLLTMLGAFLLRFTLTDKIIYKRTISPQPVLPAPLLITPLAAVEDTAA